MRIAVTGASGGLGSAIIKATAALAGRDQVVGICRRPERAASLDVEIRAGDYGDGDRYRQALEGIDSLLLVSGMDAPDRRIELHRNVIKAATAAGVGKIVYTSVQGLAEGTAFSPIIQSNRQTERDVQESGIEWAIGRNGLYIEPDVEYIETYRKHGKVANCAGAGACGYTTRAELGCAFARLLTDPDHNGQIYNLHGPAITQTELVNYLNMAFDTDLVFEFVSFEAYKAARVAELGPFIGTIIAGIYDTICKGAFNNPSDFERVAERRHQSWPDYFAEVRARCGLDAS
ncbi:MAG: NAD(P)H-binding protein [Pseudomonadota bacterium]